MKIRPVKGEIGGKTGWVGKPGVMILLGGVVICLRTASGQEEVSKEFHIKAAHILNFARFTEWPEMQIQSATDELRLDTGDQDIISASGIDSGTDPIRIGLIGKSPFGPYLATTFEGRMIHDRDVILLYFDEPQHLIRVHILFICQSEEHHLEEILDRIDGWDVLTVGDTEGYSRAGVMINFYTEDNRVRFEVNLRAVEKTGLKLSSRLLALARIIIRGEAK